MIKAYFFSSFQQELLAEYATDHKIQPEIVKLTSIIKTSNETQQMNNQYGSTIQNYSWYVSFDKNQNVILAFLAPQNVKNDILKHFSSLFKELKDINQKQKQLTKQNTSYFNQDIKFFLAEIETTEQAQQSTQQQTQPKMTESIVKLSNQEEKFQVNSKIEQKVIQIETGRQVQFEQQNQTEQQLQKLEQESQKQFQSQQFQQQMQQEKENMDQQGQYQQQVDVKEQQEFQIEDVFANGTTTPLDEEKYNNWQKNVNNPEEKNEFYLVTLFYNTSILVLLGITTIIYLFVL